MLNILSIKVCAFRLSLSSVVSGMTTGFIITTSTLFFFESYVAVVSISIEPSLSSASERESCSHSESSSSSGSSFICSYRLSGGRS